MTDSLKKVQFCPGAGYFKFFLKLFNYLKILYSEIIQILINFIQMIELLYIYGQQKLSLTEVNVPYSPKKGKVKIRIFQININLLSICIYVFNKQIDIDLKDPNFNFAPKKTGMPVIESIILSMTGILILFKKFLNKMSS